MQRIVFVNLHGNEFLLKTMNKFIYKQSCAIKHGYLLKYLIDSPDYELCTYINERGFSMASNLHPVIMRFLNLFRFVEHRIVIRKNGIDSKKITVIKSRNDIRKDDIVIAYRDSARTMYDFDKIDAFKAISMIHFFGKKDESAIMQGLNIDILFNEVDLSKHSEIFQRYYSWYDKGFIVHPFVFGERFQRIKPFSQRKTKAFATGTITYKTDKDFVEVYGDPCDQPARKQIKDNPDFFSDTIDCYSCDYNEDNKGKDVKSNEIGLISFYKKMYNKFHQGQQKTYFSFNMVEKFNEYKMCIVGEEILGVPGIGFVEGMACGCAYIGQKIGYYEDYGMREGVHYIGYDGTMDDLKRVIHYYQSPDHQDELERIANAGYEFAHRHFTGVESAEALLRQLLVLKNK